MEGVRSFAQKAKKKVLLSEFGLMMKIPSFRYVLLYEFNDIKKKVTTPHLNIDLLSPFLRYRMRFILAFHPTFSFLASSVPLPTLTPSSTYPLSS